VWVRGWWWMFWIDVSDGGEKGCPGLECGESE
jgi:hypothetical protein